MTDWLTDWYGCNQYTQITRAETATKQTKGIYQSKLITIWLQQQCNPAMGPHRLAIAVRLEREPGTAWAAVLPSKYLRYWWPCQSPSVVPWKVKRNHWPPVTTLRAPPLTRDSIRSYILNQSPKRRAEWSIWWVVWCSSIRTRLTRQDDRYNIIGCDCFLLTKWLPSFIKCDTQLPWTTTTHSNDNSMGWCGDGDTN